jgi:hypothetical protein
MWIGRSRRAGCRYAGQSIRSTPYWMNENCPSVGTTVNKPMENTCTIPECLSSGYVPHHPQCPNRRRERKASCPSDAMACSLRAFRICDHCNKEYSITLFRDAMSGGHGHNFSNCTHCGKRNDVWIRIEYPENAIGHAPGEKGSANE